MARTHFVGAPGARRGRVPTKVGAEAYDCTPQEDTRNATPRAGHYQRPPQIQSWKSSEMSLRFLYRSIESWHEHTHAVVGNSSSRFQMISGMS